MYYTLYTLRLHHKWRGIKQFKRIVKSYPLTKLLITHSKFHPLRSALVTANLYMYLQTFSSVHKNNKKCT